MSLTQAEILETLGMTGFSPARAVVEYRSRDLPEKVVAAIFKQFAGDDAELPSPRLIETVVSYLIADAASGQPLDVAGCVARTERLAKLLPYGFADAAAAEAAALRELERKAKKGPDNDSQGGTPAKPYEVSNSDGTVTRKRGRPPTGQKSIYVQVQELYASAPDKAKDTVISLLQSALKLNFGTAQTYFYKVKKESGVITA